MEQAPQVSLYLSLPTIMLPCIICPNFFILLFFLVLVYRSCYCLLVEGAVRSSRKRDATLSITLFFVYLQQLLMILIQSDLIICENS
jgi:hypothetical protein